MNPCVFKLPGKLANLKSFNSKNKILSRRSKSNQKIKKMQKNPYLYKIKHQVSTYSNINLIIIPYYIQLNEKN